MNRNLDEATSAIREIMNIYFPREGIMDGIIDEFMPEFLELAANNSTSEEWAECFNKYLRMYKQWSGAIAFMIIHFCAYNEGYDAAMDEMPEEISEQLTRDGFYDILEEYDTQ